MAKKNPISLELVIEEDDTPSVESTISALEELTDSSEPIIPLAKAVPMSPGATIGLQEDLGDVSGLIVDVDEGLECPTWAIYGKNGTGKTTLLSTAEGVLIMAPDEGTLSIKDKAKGRAKKIFIDTWGKVEAVYWLLKNGKWYSDHSVDIPVKGGTFRVRYVGWDTVTSIARVCMRNVVLGAKESDLNKDILKKTMKDWGDMSEKLKYWMQQFKALDVQNIWNFQEQSNSDEVDSEEFSIFPAVNNSVRIYALEEADIIMRTFIGKDKEGKSEFKISAKPNPNYVTKDRTGKLSGVIAKPSIEKMYKHAFGA